jgi:hypothetical protein
MESQAKEAVKGMGVIGLFMIAVGTVGTVISGLLSLIPDPQGVGTLMEAISSIMRTTMLMLPVALALGLLASAAPFGPIGLAAMVGGFEIIGALATLLIATLMPTIRELSQITIPDPASFKAVTGALVDIMHAVNGFVMALSGLAFMLRPSGTNVDPTAFQQNIGAFSTLVSAILNSGIGQIIRELTTFAQTARVKEGTADVISGIASMLGSVAQLMQAFSPSEASGRAITEIATSAFANIHSASDMMAHVERSAVIARKSLKTLLPEIKNFIIDVIGGLGTIPPGAKDVGPFVQGVATILTAVAGIMKAMSPSDASMKAVSDAATHWGEDGQAMMDSVAKATASASTGIVNLLADIKEPLVSLMTGLMGSLQPIIAAASGVDPQVMSSVAQLVGGVLGSITGMVSMLNPIINAASAQAAAAEEGANKQQIFTATMTNISTTFANLAPVLQTLIDPARRMISAIIGIAQGLKDTRQLKTKIEAVSAAIAAVGTMAQLFGPDGPFVGAPAAGTTVPISLVEGMVDMMMTVSRRILTSGGPLETIAKAFSNLNIRDTRGIKAKAEAMGSVFTATQTIATSMESMKAMGTGLGDAAISFNSRLGNVENITTAMQSISTILSAAPRSAENASARVQAIVQAYTALQTAFGTSLDEKNISQIIDLGRSLEGQRNLTVRHESLPPINMHIVVQVDGESVGEAILQNNDRIRTPAGRRFAVTQSPQ